jgi:hypothetical protein
MLEPLDNKDRFGKRAAIATLAVLAVLLGCSDDLPAPATDQRVNRDSSVDRTPAADTTITDSAPTDTGTDVGKSDAAGADATPASDATSVPLAPIIPTTSDPLPDLCHRGANHQRAGDAYAGRQDRRDQRTTAL